MYIEVSPSALPFFLLVLCSMIKTVLSASTNTQNDAHTATPIVPRDRLPQQVHISYGRSTQEIVVMWSTANFSSSVVRYGFYPENFSLSVQGQTWEFEGEGMPLGKRFMHRATLKLLEANRRYSYKVGSETVQSGPFSFRTPPHKQTGPSTFIMLADMGKQGGSATLKSLKEELEKEANVWAVIHAGDIGYDLQFDGGLVGDDFMRTIEPIASTVPYMTVPGNHEHFFDYSHYRNRFAMPYAQPDDGLKRKKFWYSLDAGLVHFVGVDTDMMKVYYYKDKGAPVIKAEMLVEQLAFLKDDLRKANTPEERQIRPWIVVYGHHPLYCSNLSGDDCSKEDSVMRRVFEELFYEHQVDIYFSGHQHSYERLWPVFNSTVAQENYVNPTAPVHLISGQTGCNENWGICMNVVVGPKGPWSAFRSSLPGFYGYGRLTIFNETHIRWQQSLAYFFGLTQDEIWIVNNRHPKGSG